MDQLIPSLHVLLDPLAPAFRSEVHRLVLLDGRCLDRLSGTPHHQPSLGNHRPHRTTQSCRCLPTVQRGRLELG